MIGGLKDIQWELTGTCPEAKGGCRSLQASCLVLSCAVWAALKIQDKHGSILLQQSNVHHLCLAECVYVSCAAFMLELACLGHAMQLASHRSCVPTVLEF